MHGSVVFLRGKTLAAMKWERLGRSHFILFKPRMPITLVRTRKLLLGLIDLHLFDILGILK
jgi:hypothetical protein